MMGDRGFMAEEEGCVPVGEEGRALAEEEECDKD